MSFRPVTRADLVALGLAVVCAATMWIYTLRILIPAQLAAAQKAGFAAGNRSDLYPAWRASLELFDRGFSPYGPQATRAIQEGFYGHALTAGDKADEQRFAYPVAVCVLLAPTRHMSFPDVQRVARILLLAFTVASVLLWLRVFRIRTSAVSMIAYLLFVMGSWPFTQGIVLAQLGLFCVFLLAIAAAAAVSGWYAVSGVSVALALLKPHVAAPVVAWFCIWAFADLRRRWRLLASLAAVTAAMLVISQYILPDWLPQWLATLRDYRQYASAEPLPSVLLGSTLGMVVEVLVIVGTFWMLVRLRSNSAESRTFAVAIAFAMAEALAVSPNWASHNQVALLPAALALWEARLEISKFGAAARVMFLVTVAALLWQWLASTLLSLTLPFFPRFVLWGARFPLAPVIVIPMAFAMTMGVYVFKKNTARPGTARTA